MASPLKPTVPSKKETPTGTVEMGSPLQSKRSVELNEPLAKTIVEMPSPLRPSAKPERASTAPEKGDTDVRR